MMHETGGKLRYLQLIEGWFVASHEHYGESVHGHNFFCRVQLELGADRHNRTCFQEVIRGLDYRHLNRLPFFRTHTPSTENIARYIQGALKERHCPVRSVEVFETVGCSGGVREC